jgi:hypothetical protein
MAAAGRPGWILFTEGLGADPNDRGGRDYRPWSDRDFGILARLNHGYHPNGTLPHSSRYDDFARRCANFVAASPGCRLWIIGNETNLAAERPRVPSRGVAAPEAPPPDPEDPLGHGHPSRFNLLSPAGTADGAPPAGARGTEPSDVEVITPERYADCFRRCREAIRALPGHAEDHVIVGGVAPWNNQTQYPDNAAGDWVRYLADILRLLGPAGCDGIALHTYTHGVDPALVTSDRKMDPPFQNRHYHFLAYRDFMDAIPASMRHLGVYITEADQDEPWLDEDNGWVQRAYEEIDGWNRTPGRQQIRALVLYRYPRFDKWHIEGKNGVMEAFRAVVARGYQWSAAAAAAPANPNWRPGSTLQTATSARLRRSPGREGKPAEDVLATEPAGSRPTLLHGGPRVVEGLSWWPVRIATAEGWMADTAPDGTPILAMVADAPGFVVDEPVFNAGDGALNLREAPGLAAKVLARLPEGGEATVLGGPREADGLVWWRLRAGPAGDAASEGWSALRAPDGTVLLAATGYRGPPGEAGS